MIKVEDMMTRNPHTLLRTHTLADARHMMEALDIRHIPIVDANRKLLGVITHRDVLAAQESSLYNQNAETSYTEETPLYEVMHTGVMSVAPQAGLKESAIYMQKHKVGCLPVVSKGELVGIITDSDFVTIAINLLELQEDTEPDEIELDDTLEDDLL
ncbi:CBS domain-containing protein [Vibrio cincinnatiensis]|jgi:CBS domain-containing protein|uniref:CBS domain-containing protein n=1 Tax=Vibrio cincinnatiensis DSM 19608 TaxID=1123491 RepID=A0A1T4N980_VIBCI|nr:CBS domain-containing protein [Vibrio cincinnatiensis]MCG3721124.1 CBS domain-containing protein [Vibrio cincinnatiensis]MCG3725045.1 CBS domain-containing protein [Vibrio cincinnatiensis]MCG3731953.1 CBS domain-containing protein [Vibrio cincinnatiensis]MCG3735371.1 CBS domain-containing protein [Vibrio cincinnatiensis]MCG3739347.1 CBS domain-containing protein [Vibrio cincinnatiensis]